MRSASSESEAQIWWLILGLGGLFVAGIVVGVLIWYLRQSYFVQGNGEQQKSPGETGGAEQKGAGSRQGDVESESGSEEESNGEVPAERINQMDSLIETLKEGLLTIVEKVVEKLKNISKEIQRLSDERIAFEDERERLSNLADRFERLLKIDEKLNERLREKENLNDKDTAQLVEDLLDLYETVCKTFGAKPRHMGPDDAEREVHNLDAAMRELWAVVGRTDGYESKTLREKIEAVAEESREMKNTLDEKIKKEEEIREWAKDILMDGRDHADDPIEQSQDQLRRVMEMASNGKQISTLGALQKKVENLREEADRVPSLRKKLSSRKKSLKSARKEIESLEQKVGNLEGAKNDIEKCLTLLCDKISIDPIDKSGERWAEDVRRRLENYTDDDWQALLGISASLLAFDKAQSDTENSGALLDKLHIGDLENELRLFSTKLERAGIQEMIPNAFSDGWLHTLFRAKAVIDAYFQEEHPEVKDAVDQAEAVMRTLLHRINGDYHTLSLPVSLEEQKLPGGSPDTDHGSDILDLPGIREKIKSAYEEKGGRIAYDVRVFPHRYDESGFKHATVYVASPSWLTS